MQADDGRIGHSGRVDRTPGGFDFERSPFRSAGCLIAALIVKTNAMWCYRSIWIGGQGQTPCALKENSDIEMLYLDAQGNWWLQHEIFTGVWVPDIARTLALAEPPDNDDVTPINSEHIRNGEA